MEIFKELKNLGYKHYVDLTIEELDKLPIDNIEKRIEYSLVIDWFRERYNLHLIPIYSYNDILHWSYHIEDIVTGECYIPLIDNGLTLKSTKYEAREQAILKAIRLCQNKK